MLDCHPSFSLDSLSVTAIQQQSDRFAIQLHKQGIRPGDRVAFLLPTSVKFLALFLAALQCNITIAPLSRYIPTAQIEHTLTRLDAKWFIDSYAITNAPRTTLYPPFSSPTLLLSTSGSTAMPKIAALPLQALCANAHSAIHALSISPSDRLLLNLPLYHVSGIAILLRAMISGASLTLNPTDPHITLLSATPTHLFRSPPLPPKLRTILIGGAPIPPRLPPHLPLAFSYGLTEMSSLTALGSPTSPYCPLQGKELHLAEDGEIFVKGNSLFAGYWAQGALSPSLNKNGWFATGDLGKQMGAGITITGRKDWQFISGGENIQPEEIEQALLTITGIEEAVVLPKADPEFGARPVAFLVGNPPPLGELQHHLHNLLPKFKIPIAFSTLSTLPKKGLKIDRKQLIINYL